MYFAERLLPETCFVPLDDKTNLTVLSDRTITVEDTNAPSSQTRFYRVHMQRQ